MKCEILADFVFTKLRLDVFGRRNRQSFLGQMLIFFRQYEERTLGRFSPKTGWLEPVNEITPRNHKKTCSKVLGFL